MMEKFYIVNRKLSVLMFVGMLLTFGLLRMGYAAPVFNDKFWDHPNQVWVDGKTTRALPQHLAIGTDIGPPLEVTSTGTDLTYSLGGTDASTFTLDSGTGQLRTAAVLNYDTKTEYDVTVTATDSSGTATIDVKILVSMPWVPDWLADYSPWEIEYEVSGIVPAGTVVGKVWAFGTDAEGDPWHCYLSSKTSDYATFTIDWEKGHLTTTKPLNYHDQKTYNLIYVATDAWIQHKKKRPNVEGFALSWDVTITLDGAELLAREAQEAAEEEEKRKAAAEAEVLRRQPIKTNCPVGWQQQDPFGASTERALIYCLWLEVNENAHSGIYKARAIEIYTNPNDNLKNLDGWTLKLAVPHNNHYRDYLLTAENSIIRKDGIARIESPEEAPFPMTDVYFAGRGFPGFDYRLFNAEGRRVDFAASCYRKAAFSRNLRLMDDPCIVREITPRVEKGAAVETEVTIDRLDWTGDYYFSQWRVPEAVPSAPTALKKPLVSTWAALKGGKK